MDGKDGVTEKNGLEFRNVLSREGLDMKEPGTSRAEGNKFVRGTK